MGIIGSILYFFVWIIGSLIIAMWATSWRRSFFGWFMIALLISPIIGAIILAIMGENKEAAERAKLGIGDLKQCPYCAELVKAEAIKCKHCGTYLNPGAKQQDAPNN